MTLKELLDNLRNIDKKLQSSEDMRFKSILKSIKDYLIEIFSLAEEEVALIMKDEDSFGYFVLPLALLAKSNSFPLRKSTVTRDVFDKGRSFLSNNASSIHRLSFYEMISITNKKPCPIQKFIALPIIQDDSIFGVLWLSRRGINPEEAGRDFSESDLKNTEHLIKIIAPFLYNSKPGKFV